MLLGPFAGQRVFDVKTKVRDLLVERGEAVIYYEPERRVVSRNDDVCVVALTEQWYLRYSDEDWRKAATEYVSQMFGLVVHFPDCTLMSMPGMRDVSVQVSQSDEYLPCRNPCSAGVYVGVAA